MEQARGMNQQESEKRIKSTIEHSVGTVFIPALQDLPLVNRKLEAAAIMSELEYMFTKRPAGFYMFYEPHPEQPEYKKGNSWCEKFYININDFKLSFDQIGIRYNSYQEFAQAADKFGESNKKYYCSYYDKSREQAYYLRNNALVNEAIKSVLGEETVKMLCDDNLDERNRLKKQPIKKSNEENKAAKH
jgi:hypothetical protein